MTVHLTKYGISYFGVPKVACTSLKLFFFEVENGFAFRPFQANGVKRHIHDAAYPTVPFKNWKPDRYLGHWKIAVVRDPVQRLLSCYSNRVLDHGELDNIVLTEEDIANGMTTRPDLHKFLEHFHRYRELAPSIAHHSDRMVDFLGANADFFDRIYSIRELDQLALDVSDRVGESLQIPREQTGGPKIGQDALTSKEKKLLRRFYEEDFAAFGDYF